jgi:type I restriction enzyme S subunit
MHLGKMYSPQKDDLPSRADMLPTNKLDEWFYSTIGSQATLQRGFDITKAEQRSGAVPVVSSSGISSFHDLAKVKGPGVVLGRKGVVGSVHFLEVDFWPHDTTLWVKDFHGNNPKFVYYFFLSNSNELKGLDVGSANPTLNRNHVHPIKTIWPTLAEQNNIAEFLGALDDRIALLRETNATLEAMAQALFKSWFVDFDPVHANASTKQMINPASSPSDLVGDPAAPLDSRLRGNDDLLPPELQTLFPATFTETPQGLVPEGWKMRPLGDVATVVKGKSYTSKELADSHTTALVTLKSFARGGGFRMDGFKPYTGKFKTEQVVEAGDLIVAYTDVTQAAELIGKPALVVEVAEYDTLVASLDVGIVRPKTDAVSRQYLYGLFCTEQFQAHTYAHTSGTTVLHLAKDAVASYEFACPPKAVIDAFSAIADSMAERKQVNADQIRTLATLRDTLLPRLISGQLRLPEADAMQAEVCDV